MMNRSAQLDAAGMAKIAHLVKQGRGEVLGGLIGAGVGVGGGALLRYMLNQRYKTPKEKQNPAKDMIMGGLLGAAAGAGVGRLVGQGGKLLEQPQDVVALGQDGKPIVAPNGGKVTEETLRRLQDFLDRNAGAPVANFFSSHPYWASLGVSALRPTYNRFAGISWKGGKPFYTAVDKPLKGFDWAVNTPGSGAIALIAPVIRSGNNLYRYFKGDY